MPAWKTAAYGIAGVFSILVALMLLLVLGYQAMEGEPFRMNLRRVDDGRVIVQFSRPDRELVSPEFPVEIPLDSPREAILRSSKIGIPGCIVEFYDPTLLPGRFQVRIGHVLYDVMASGIVVDGKDFDWQPL